MRADASEKGGSEVSGEQVTVMVAANSRGIEGFQGENDLEERARL